MSKMTRVIKVCTDHEDIINRYLKDKHGVSRTKYGWSVRLNFIYKRPTIQKHFNDSEGSRFTSLEKALNFRDTERCKLVEACVRFGNIKKPCIDEGGKLKNLYLSKSTRKNSVTYQWVVNLGDGRSRKFTFWRNRKIVNAFVSAVLFLRKTCIIENGSSEVKKDMKSIHGYLNAYLITLDKSSNKYRSIRKFL